MTVAEVLEFWPEYEGAPLWTEHGVSVDLDALALPGDLRDRLGTWAQRHGDDKLPLEGPGDEPWLAEGRGLLAEVRTALDGGYEVVATEPWWGDEPS